MERETFRSNWTYHNVGCLRGIAESYTMGDFMIWCDGYEWKLTTPNGNVLYHAKNLITIINKIYKED